MSRWLDTLTEQYCYVSNWTIINNVIQTYVILNDSINCHCSGIAVPHIRDRPDLLARSLLEEYTTTTFKHNYSWLGCCQDSEKKSPRVAYICVLLCRTSRFRHAKWWWTNQMSEIIWMASALDLFCGCGGAFDSVHSNRQACCYRKDAVRRRNFLPKVSPFLAVPIYIKLVSYLAYGEKGELGIVYRASSYRMVCKCQIWDDSKIQSAWC